MTDQQTDALRLADALEGHYSLVYRHPAAAELRRLHDRDKEWESVTGFMQGTIDRFESELLRLTAINAQLLEALDEIASTEVYSPEGGHEAVAECNRIARAAIEAAHGMGGQA